MSRSYDYDVLLLSDLRYPGGNSASIAEEVKAQARAGYSTALMHVPAPHMTRTRTFSRKIMNCLSAGLAELVPADRPVRVRTLIIRQPRLFTHDPPVRPRVTADATVLVVNHPPFDGLRGRDSPYYDVAAVHRRVKRLFGEAQWAPIGPLVREALARTGVALPLREEDWVNIVDVDDWWTDRTHFRADRPVIGRHSRGHPTKWPSTAADILAAYPADDGIEVKILGGADPAIKTLGVCPRQWTVYPFGAMPAERFLRQIDFFVYYHHPDWVEAFGRNIIEALASGCPAILPPHFERVFGDSCLYAPPAGVRSIVESLYGDIGRYRSWSERSTVFVSTRFGPAVHLRRIAALAGDPDSARQPEPGRRRGSRTLLIAAVPTGLGSVTRLLRVTEGLPDDSEPILLAPWPAMELGREAGMLCEMLPDDELRPENAELLAQRIELTVQRHRADRVLVDARAPSSGLVAAALSCDVPFVWIRPHADDDNVSGGFAATVSVAHSGLATADGSREASMLTLRHGQSPLTRAAARVAIDVPQDAQVALLCCGGDARGVLLSSLGVLSEELVAQGWTVVFAEPLVGGDAIRLDKSVRRIALRPLPTFLNAFDVAVAGPGRTLVAELVAAQLPTLLVPLRSDPLQSRLGVTAREQGVALWMETFHRGVLLERLAELSDERARDELARACVAMRTLDARQSVLDALSRCVPGHASAMLEVG